MRTTIASVFLLFFLFSTKSCLFSITNAQLVPLYDIEGNKVLAGFPYYIVSTIRGAGGGGLYPSWPVSPDHLCPKFVAQHTLDLQRGAPVVLIPTDPRPGAIHVGEDVSITFLPEFDPFCRSSNTWVVSKYDPLEQRWWINMDDFGGLKSFFQFQSTFSDSYNIVACYTDGVTVCNHLDLFGIEGFAGRRLGFGKGQQGPWPFHFVKAPAEAIQQVVGTKEPK